MWYESGCISPLLSGLMLAVVAVRAEPIFGLTTTNSIVRFEQCDARLRVRSDISYRHWC